jgi:hypothetical protein
MKKLIITILSASLLFTATACSKKEKVNFEKIQTGEVNKSNTYTNDSIGLTVKFPKDWIFLSSKDYPSSLKGNKNMKPLAVISNTDIKDTNKQADYVFQIHTIKSTISAEDQLYGIKAQAEMLTDLKMKTGDVTNYKLNGKTFYSLESQIEGQGTTTTLVYDAGDYNIQFIGFIKSGNKTKPIESIINSIKIK